MLDINIIHKLRKQRMSFKQIGKMFSVSKQAVHQIYKKYELADRVTEAFYPERETRICPQCKEDFKACPSWSKKYCSIDCFKEYVQINKVTSEEKKENNRIITKKYYWSHREKILKKNKTGERKKKQRGYNRKYAQKKREKNKKATGK